MLGGIGGIPGSPGESGLVSRGSQGLRSPLESRRGSIGAPCAADAGRDWGQEEKGTTEDEMAGWHH